ncbi:hypothetical protein DSM112329_03097 [Paraconexibacter sp. AEG42_29]|uniref:Asl1-like glycosyl hydrolase catalytic domain-containing protein n=1 Tax=Paraconexibacter sp. AEG42_29 TaxID=2997339 RepID=A0AAU7AX44_9ACTN
MRRILILLVPLLLAMSFSATAAEAKPVLGIADQKPETFQDQRLKDLKLKYARLYIPWDVLKDRHSLEVTDRWMAGAKADRLEPLLTIARSRVPSKIRIRPSEKALVAEFKKWRKRWPGQVSKISTWNEANESETAARVGGWWLALRKACPTCTVLGADLLDSPNVLQWASDFAAFTQKKAKKKPTIWGLHAYNDANTYRTTITKAILKGVKGDIWITETGGVSTRPRPIYTFTACGVKHQTKATSFLLNNIAKLSPRIKRIYIFNWGLGSNDASFDSALVDAENRERPSLNVIRKFLGQPEVTMPEGGFSPGSKTCKFKGTRKASVPKAVKKAKTTKKK